MRYILLQSAYLEYKLPEKIDSKRLEKIYQKNTK